MNNSILSELFEEIRNDKSWPLPGMDEFLLLQTLLLSKEVPIRGFEELAFILRTLWLKSYDSNDVNKFNSLILKRKHALIELTRKLSTWTDHTDEELEKVAFSENSNQRSFSNKEQHSNSDFPLESVYDTEGVTQEAGHSKENETTVNFQMPSKEIIRKSESNKIESFENSNDDFLFTKDYFPIRNRQLQHTWRTLIANLPGPPSNEIDIKATIHSITNKGYFSGFKYQREKYNKIHLYIFIDHSDSMITVDEFGKELVNSALQTKMYPNLISGYFNKIPVKKNKTADYLLGDESGTKYTSLHRLFRGCHQRDIAVLIYSDAGALRGIEDENRLNETQEFIKHLGQQCGYIAWLNPAPRERWVSTNAAKIAFQIPMFDTSRSEFEAAINALRGKITIKIPEKHATD